MSVPRRDLAERFWEKVDRSNLSGCWEFRGANKDGYGMFMIDRATGPRKAHQVAWELTKGPRGELWVLHHCDNPACVNPDHLYLGTARENGRDMSRRGRARGSKVTHCPQGHPYDEVNTRFDERGRRRCRECRRVKRRAAKDRNGYWS